MSHESLDVLLSFLEATRLPAETFEEFGVRVGRLGALDLVAVDAAPREVRRIAAGLARRGRLAVVVGTGAHAGSVAVSLSPVTCAVLARPHDRDPVLRRLRHAARTLREGPPLAQAVAFSQALDIDAAGRHTFRLLRQFVDRAVDLLPAPVPRAERHGWALVQITRLLFLRFVEAEGWLAGNPRFLGDALDDCLGHRRDPARDLLHPLFFGTLNMPPDRRSRLARRFGVIPFLNGGLFEPHPLERRHRFALPVDYWRDLCDALVERIDVTLDASPEDGRVTPEMLGRVFEGVMHPDERRRDGAFFTPPALVDTIAREAIAHHLGHRLGRDPYRLARELDDPDPILSRALLDVTVLDPAVGSGAFLVGALALLHGPSPRDPARVGQLVARRLFGIDRHPDAVRLTELRLWLEVLRALRGRAPTGIPPLPNLDATIRAGDALLDPLRGAPISCRSAALLDSRQRALRSAHGIEKRAALRQIRTAERDAVVAVLRSREAALERDIRETLETGRAPELLERRPGLSAPRQRYLSTARNERRLVREERRRVVRDTATPIFAAEVAFAPLLAERRGFDLVLGNPPWVRAERLPRAVRAGLQGRFRWWRSAGTGWRHLPDLAVAFIERSHELLAPHGTMALLVPAKLATADYATRCRAALNAHTTLHAVADLSSDSRAGFEATTYPLAIIASKRSPPRDHRVRLGLGADSDELRQAEWQDAAQWSVSAPAAQRVAAHLARAFPPLAARVTPQLGLKTGANQAFLDPPSELWGWCREAVRGRDVRTFRITSRLRLLWPADDAGEPWPDLPEPIARHLAAHEGALKRRADLRGAPWWRLFRTSAATAPHRVVWGDLARRLEAATLPSPSRIPLNSCYVAALASESEALALAAWLNATWIRALARLRAEPAAGGAARFGARTVGALPLPSAALHDEELIALAAAPFALDTPERLDERVAALLRLSATDRDALAPLAASRR